MKRISVVGIGRIGLCTAAYFASRGYGVIASSNEQHKLELIRKGKSPFFEPDLDKILSKTLTNGKLKLVVGREEAVTNTDITFITVGTPSLSDGSADLTFLRATAKEIGIAIGHKKEYHLVVVKSTVPPGTTENLVKPIIEKHSKKHAGKDFGLAMSPEFLKEGTLIHDTAHPDRVLIGEFDKRSGDMLENLNIELYGKNVPLLRMSLASAELAKYASNAFLATKISFINQIANICERIAEVDVAEIAQAMGLDPRIGPDFLRAGAGWGGSCFPKDTKALIAMSRELGYEPELIKASVIVNEMQGRRMVELAEEEVGDLREKRVAVLGLSFKPNTDDIREAPSLAIIKLLLDKGAKVVVFDPVAMTDCERIFGGKVVFSKNVHQCLEGADCCMLVTEWKQFKELNPSTFKKLMHTPILIDGRRTYNPKAFSKALKFRAIGMGKQSE